MANKSECRERANPIDPNGCTPQWVPIVRGSQPQFGGVPVEGAYVTSTLDWLLNYQCTTESSGNDLIFTWSSNISAPDGSVHQFGTGSSVNGAGCIQPPYRALDASGILQSDGSTIVMPNGTHFNFPTNGNPSFVDANGNTISLSSNSYTDTLGDESPPAPIRHDFRCFTLPRRKRLLQDLECSWIGRR